VAYFENVEAVVSFPVHFARGHSFATCCETSNRMPLDSSLTWFDAYPPLCPSSNRASFEPHDYDEPMSTLIIAHMQLRCALNSVTGPHERIFHKPRQGVRVRYIFCICTRAQHAPKQDFPMAKFNYREDADIGNLIAAGAATLHLHMTIQHDRE
jgi:hypothetical protein